MNAFRNRLQNFFMENPTLFFPLPQEANVQWHKNRKLREKTLTKATTPRVRSGAQRDGDMPGFRRGKVPKKERATYFRRSISFVNRFNIHARPRSGGGGCSGIQFCVDTFVVRVLDLTEYFFPGSVYGNSRLADLDPLDWDIAQANLLASGLTKKWNKDDFCAVAAALSLWFPRGGSGKLKGTPERLMHQTHEALTKSLFDGFLGVLETAKKRDHFYESYVKLLDYKYSTGVLLERSLTKLLKAIKQRRSFMEEAATRGKEKRGHKTERGAGHHPRYTYTATIANSFSNSILLIPFTPNLNRYMWLHSQIFDVVCSKNAAKTYKALRDPKVTAWIKACLEIRLGWVMRAGQDEATIPEPVGDWRDKYIREERERRKQDQNATTGCTRTLSKT